MYEFDRSTPVTVVLRAQSGDIRIVAEERGTVEVDVQPMGGNGTEAAQTTKVILEDDTLLIQVPGADFFSWRRTPKLLITARVPAGSGLAGKSAAADVRATGRYGTVQLDVASADVRLEEATGDVQLEAASGDLFVDRVGGSLRGKSSSGDVRIGDVTGDVTLETASGDIRTGAVGGSLRAKSASGDIEIGMLSQGKAVLNAASGDITVGVARGSNVWMDLNTASGKSVTDLAAQGDVPPADNPVELELRVKTASGDIRVRRAAHHRTAAA